MDVKGRTAIILGGTSGIGLAASIRLAALGAKVVAVSRSPERAGDVPEGITLEACDVLPMQPGCMGNGAGRDRNVLDERPYVSALRAGHAEHQPVRRNLQELDRVYSNRPRFPFNVLAFTRQFV